jgi:hypothetical protein
LKTYVLWTDFLDVGKIPSAFGNELAIESVVKTLVNKGSISYLALATADGVKTPLTEAYQSAILAKNGADSLEEALEKLRANGRE